MYSDQLLLLRNRVKNYSWGSSTALSEFFDFLNPEGLPQAEVWIGAHERMPSSVILEDEQFQLNDLIRQHPQAMLGSGIASRFNNKLPFLLKIISVASPLSVQVHPAKQQAEAGFFKENQAGIPKDSLFRNYPDNNHKPELIYALNHFQLLAGFKPVAEILTLFKQLQIPLLKTILESFSKNKSANGLMTFCYRLMTFEKEIRQQIIDAALLSIMRSEGEELEKQSFRLVAHLHHYFTEDMGIFAPLLLNYVELQPGQAAFIAPCVPHTYLSGTGLEVMASSDNVLRGGLTSKHIDVQELVDIVDCHSCSPEDLRIEPVIHQGVMSWPVPVDDFVFSILTMEGENRYFRSKGLELIFCMKGTVKVEDHQGNDKVLEKGDACAVPARVIHYGLCGTGTVVLVGNSSLLEILR